MTPEEVRSVFYAEMEQLLLEFFPDASDALVFNHDVFDKDYEVIEQKTKTPKTPESMPTTPIWCTTI